MKKKELIPVELSLFEDLIKDTNNLFSQVSLDGIITYVSPTILNILGYDQKNLINTSAFNIIHPDDHQAIHSFCTNITEPLTFRIRRKIGDYIWLETSCIMVNHHEYIFISHDITERKVYEEELREEKEKYRLLIENSEDTIGIITNTGFFIDINQAGKRLLGASRKEEIIGNSLLDYIVQEDHELLCQYLSNPTQPMEDPLEVSIQRVDFLQKNVEVKLIPLYYKKRYTYQIIIRDITNKKEAEQMLQQAEKLSIVGQLAAGIAHEIRNPLTAIKGFAQLLNNMGQKEYTDVILTELNRIEKIVSDLLVLAKPQLSNFQTIDLQELIDSVVTLLNTQAIIYNIEITSLFQLANPLVEAEEDKLKQVFINMIKNAIEAMPDGGNIRIITKENSENQVVIQIIDEGVGIPEERISKIGEPFFSTKETGTGLGFMICQRIIKNHRGSIQIESEVNQGTVITIILPQNIK
ncbi:PAS domain S-box protein [Oikeobacillus pervagus]|nr:PAS domain S-box protein [Oikeobacillus pervagus]